jgi:hypothetical protein
MSLNETVLFAGVGSKLVPVMVTELPIRPRAGLKLVIVGAVGEVTANAALVAVLPPTVTVTGPGVAPLGTAVTSCMALAELTVAATPLNLTVSFAPVVLKFVPVIVTEVPTIPLVGVKLVIVGGVVTV